MSKIRLGVIGFGNIGTMHVNNQLSGSMPRIEIAAVADRKADRRAAAAELLGEKVPVFCEGEELIKSGTCDAILIAVPHVQHPPLAIMAFQNGLHVVCEKPAGVDAKNVRLMNEEAAKHPDLVFAMMFNQRTDCVYRKMREIVTNGELGAIKRVNWIITNWYRPQFYYDSGAWRATWAGEGGGVLLNQCPHNLDLLQWICGLPKKVHAFCHNGKWHDIEVEDDVTAYMEFENGATGVFVTTTADAPGTNRFEITGEMGKLVCEDGQLTFHRLSENERAFCKAAKAVFAAPECTVEVLETDGQNPQHVGILNNFADAVLDHMPLIASGEEGIQGIRLSNAMHLSSWLEKTVTLPVDEEEFLAQLNIRRAHSRHKEGDGIYSSTEGSWGK